MRLCCVCLSTQNGNIIHVLSVPLESRQEYSTKTIKIKVVTFFFKSRKARKSKTLNEKNHAPTDKCRRTKGSVCVCVFVRIYAFNLIE
jgi:hypothetical protein